ncbi:protein NRT1/ PTR FAMILY 1.2 [Ziziphus jujuba]|uniref:Protein NRT1/ PTR FAMILY 1.2 n=1 Tax=Ziziphus jujuba TaxID=326968 RepID=A0A6P4AAP3_ZIZJJ|nr:protein NRT1/ PTR FAMILY 1.2 [Ziziphus jujuba]
MAISQVEENAITVEEPLLPGPSSAKGGIRTLPFIIANEAFERVSNYGLQPDMILYLTGEYGMRAATSATINFLWSAATDFTPIVGAFIADSYVGRYPMIGFGCIVSFLGTLLLWLTTIIPQARPSCNELTSTCEDPTTSQLLVLLSSFALMAIGAGGIRSCSLAFGADQLDKKKDYRNARLLESFFNWYNISVNVSLLVAFSCIVYVQEHMGWILGFGIPAVLMLLSAISFFLASPFYAKLKAKESVLTRLAQVVAASYKNRDIQLSSFNKYEYYHIKGSIASPSDNLRCLNKACIIRNPHEDLTPEGRASDPWRLCTVKQVEDLKALIRILPIWTTGVLMALTVSQSSFPVLQANTMDRTFFKYFEIPAGSFPIFVVIAFALWLGFYDRVLLPIASKIKGKSVRLSSKVRMGIGIVISIIAMLTAATVENIRRNKAYEQGIQDNPDALVNMSASWLLLQNILIGIAEAFNTIGQIEFFYSECPKNMASVALTFAALGRSGGNVLGSILMSSVDSITENGKQGSWVSTNINHAHYDYYCLVLSGIGFINLMYYIACSKAYGPCRGEGKDFMQIIPMDEESECEY